MKRLLCILNNMNVGGAETFLMKLYRVLDKTKYQFDFCLCSSFKSFYEDEIITNGGKVYHITSKSENYKKFKEQLLNIVSINKYKYVLKITANSMGIIDLKICKKAGAEVLGCRSSNSNDIGCKNKLLNYVGKLLYSNVPTVKIAPSDLAAKYTFGNSKNVHYIYNGIDFNQYKFDLQKRNSTRSLFNIKEEDVLIGHIGRFDLQKNHTFLIDVFNKVTQKKQNVKLMLVGVGEKQNDIIKKVEALGLQNKVIFAGFQNDVQAYLSAMDIFVFPSLYEGMPNTVIEAQTNGLTCIVSDSITRMCDIGGNVKFISLYSNAQYWSNIICECLKINRNTGKQLFKNSDYNINNSCRNFCKLIFEEEQ